VEVNINAGAARRKLGLPEQGFVAGFVGRLDPCKDIPHLVAAAAMPDTLLSDDRILLVGEGGDRPRIEQAISACGLTGRAILAGDLRGRPLLEAYAAMDVLVLPSLYEGYGMVVLEAMAQARAVIGRLGNGRSSFTSMAEMIDPGETGLLMHADDPADLAVRLRWCRRHRAELRQMGQWAQGHLRSRPWVMVVADYLRLMGITSRPAASWRAGLAA
jgi:D-inositol-3-phosphate glycosyltransferase